jgi:hypothetical protein
MWLLPAPVAASMQHGSAVFFTHWMIWSCAVC